VLPDSCEVKKGVGFELGGGVEEAIRAVNPIEPFSSRLTIILSRPTKAPLSTKSMLVVSEQDGNKESIWSAREWRRGFEPTDEMSILRCTPRNQQYQHSTSIAKLN
jgi:hypothetical protein